MKEVSLDKPIIDQKKALNDILIKYQNDEYFKQNFNKLRKEFPQANLIDIIDVVNNQRSCLECRGLEECQQEFTGYYLALKDDVLVYSACQFKEEKMKLAKKYETLIFSTNAQPTLANTNDLIAWPTRQDILKHINLLLDNKTDKGLFIYGSVGVGKTFIVESLMSTYLDKKINCAYVLLNDLYNEIRPLYFSTLNSDRDVFNRMIKRLKNVNVLFIDDIGAERMDHFMRDDVLFPILDYRMKNKKMTHFTSNYDLASLKDHFSNTSSVLKENIKGERIVERIRVLCEVFKLEEKKSLRE